MENNYEFSEAMSKRTDDELIKIVTIDRDNYQQSAVEAAEYEIRNRGIDFSRVEEVKSSLIKTSEEQRIFDSNKAKTLIRFTNYIIDSIVFIVADIIALNIVVLILRRFSENIDHSTFTILFYAITFISYFAYYALMEYKYQRTLGKFLTKTIVVTKDGQKPTLNDIIGRTFCRLIPFDNISFLFTRNGFHDYLSSTIVIKGNNNNKSDM